MADVPGITAEQISAMTEQEREKLTRGTKTVVAGFPGSGKTDSLVSFLEAEIPLRVIGTEPGFEESIIDAVHRRGLSDRIDLLNYMYVPPVSAGFSNMKEMAEKVNMMSYGDLATLKNGIAKQDHKQFLNLLDALNDFTCDRTGKKLGPVDEFPKDVACAIDSLTGINIMAQQNTVGGKPTLHEGEWGVAQGLEEGLIRTLCSNLKCFVVVTSHVQKNFNEVTGEIEFSIDAIGKKLGPRIPTFFSDYVVASREGHKFKWSTMADNFNQKSRALPISNQLEPSFVQIVEVWRKRNELVNSTSATES